MRVSKPAEAPNGDRSGRSPSGAISEPFKTVKPSSRNQSGREKFRRGSPDNQANMKTLNGFFAQLPLNPRILSLCANANRQSLPEKPDCCRDSEFSPAIPIMAPLPSFRHGCRNDGLFIGTLAHNENCCFLPLFANTAA